MTIQIFTCLLKILNEKKCLRLFNKKTPLYARLGSKQKALSNCQATYQKELCLLFFHRANVQIGLTPPFLPIPVVSNFTLLHIHQRLFKIFGCNLDEAF